MTDRIVYASDIIDSHILNLRTILAEALNLANEACDYLQSTERSAAVGKVIPIADLLSAATAIHGTILLLNRQRG